jgi:general secretion pathway protein C
MVDLRGPYLNTLWLEPAGERLDKLRRLAFQQLRSLSDPGRSKQVRQALGALAGLWLLLAVANMVWSLLPQPEPESGSGLTLNPQQTAVTSQQQAPVNIEELVAWNLFGTAASKPVPQEKVEDPAAGRAKGDLDGIENSAKETRLSLKLKGIVGSSVPSLARAIIENKKKQKQYALGDSLPVSGKVTVAKILNDRVVLDNAGKYELLMLFDKNAIASRPLQPERAPVKAGRRLDKRGSREVTQMAESYRQRLYSNPQALSDVVKIAAVRSDGKLRGYRVSAGKDKKQFSSLGFEANDIVTGVNGVELTDPGKAMELYRIMRSAEEASFNVLRGGEELTLTVGLGNVADSP